MIWSPAFKALVALQCLVRLASRYLDLKTLHSTVFDNEQVYHIKLPDLTHHTLHGLAVLALVTAFDGSFVTPVIYLAPFQCCQLMALIRLHRYSSLPR